MPGASPGRTRCARCGTIADYRLEYVFDKDAYAELTCRVCCWIAWADKAVRMAARVSEVMPDADIRALADENDYDIGSFVLPRTRVNQPVVLKCRRCDKLKVSRVLDIHWGCGCHRAKRRAEEEANLAARRGYIERPPIGAWRSSSRTSGHPAVAWWEHDRNQEALFQNVFPSAKKVVSWGRPDLGPPLRSTGCSNGRERRLFDLR